MGTQQIKVLCGFSLAAYGLVMAVCGELGGLLHWRLPTVLVALWSELADWFSGGEPTFGRMLLLLLAVIGFLAVVAVVGLVLNAAKIVSIAAAFEHLKRASKPLMQFRVVRRGVTRWRLWRRRRKGKRK